MAQRCALCGGGGIVRRWPRFDTVGLVVLFLAPLVPVAMLASSAIALFLLMLLFVNGHTPNI